MVQWYFNPKWSIWPSAGPYLCNKFPSKAALTTLGFKRTLPNHAIETSYMGASFYDTSGHFWMPYRRNSAKEFSAEKKQMGLQYDFHLLGKEAVQVLNRATVW